MKQSIEYKEMRQIRFWLADLIKTVKNHPEKINIIHELFQLNEFEGDMQACEQDIMTYFEGRKYVFAGKMLNGKRFSKFNLN